MRSMYVVDQAPQIVINRMRQEKRSIQCCLCWSWICCIPTMGVTLVALNDPVTENEKGVLSATIKLLEELCKPSEQSGRTGNELARWQTDETLKILRRVKSNEHVIAFKSVLNTTYDRMSLEVSTFTDGQPNKTEIDLLLPNAAKPPAYAAN